MKSRLVSFLILFLSAGSVSERPARAEQPAAQAVLAISDAHRRFLSRIASRTIRDAVLRRNAYEPGYVPAALDSLETEVVLRVRERGYLLAAGVGGPSPIALATRDAALAAVGMVMKDR